MLWADHRCPVICDRLTKHATKRADSALRSGEFGGARASGSSAFATFIRTSFAANSADSAAGLVLQSGARARMLGCTFEDNTADLDPRDGDTAVFAGSDVLREVGDVPGGSSGTVEPLTNAEGDFLGSTDTRFARLQRVRATMYARMLQQCFGSAMPVTCPQLLQLDQMSDVTAHMSASQTPVLLSQAAHKEVPAPAYLSPAP